MGLISIVIEVLQAAVETVLLSWVRRVHLGAWRGGHSSPLSVAVHNLVSLATKFIIPQVPEGSGEQGNREGKLLTLSVVPQ